MLEKQEKRIRRHKRVRAKISGTAKVPRLYVYRTPRHIYAQMIDDDKGKTILNSSDLEIKKTTKDTENQTKKVAVAYEVGKSIAKKALEKKISEVVFDRGGYKYHGRVKAVAEGARKQGLKF